MGLLSAQPKGLEVEGYNLEAIWEIEGNDSLFAFGISLAAGDVNGDGFSDILIAGDTLGPDQLIPDSAYLGKGYLFYGGSLLDTIPDLVFSSTYKGGFSISVTCGDINGDGIADVVLGDDWMYPESVGANGGVKIYLGGIALDTVPDLILKGTHCSGFGVPVSIAGDVNGDGYDDLIVGAYGSRGFRGRVYIYFGGPGLDTIPDVVLEGGHEGYYENFGNSVGSGGDVNDDGFDDVIVGALAFGPGVSPPGRIYIYFGGNPMDTSFAVAMMGEGPAHLLGMCGVDLLRNSPSYGHATFGNSLWPNGFFSKVRFPIGPGLVIWLLGVMTQPL